MAPSPIYLAQEAMGSINSRAKPDIKELVNKLKT
jgi:hypothetical protein